MLRHRASLPGPSNSFLPTFQIIAVLESDVMSAMADDSQLSAGESTAGNAIENDSDWEYEYHETETEVHCSNLPLCIVAP